MTSDQPLAGLRAVVVGGSSGIGLATTRLLAADGCRVTIAARDELRMRRVVDVFAADGLEIGSVACDTMIEADIARAVEIASEGDRLDIAVTVPGGGTPKHVLDYECDAFSAEVDKNVRPVYMLLHYSAPLMTNGGSFIAVSSTAAVFSTRGLASYRSGKAAVDALIDVAADELGEKGIRVNSVRPGLTAIRVWALTRAALPRHECEQLQAGLPERNMCPEGTTWQSFVQIVARHRDRMNLPFLCASAKFYQSV